MNSSGKLQGKHSNPPLNGKGNAQADALGVALAERFQRQRQEFVLVNSPLLRAQQTAWHVARHCGSLCHWERANPMDEFNEIDFGDTPAGMTREDAIARVHPVWVAWSQGNIDAREKGTTAESLRTILHRFQAGLARLYSLCGSGSVPGVVVTHSGLLSIIMAAAHAYAVHPQGLIVNPAGANVRWLSDPRTWGLERPMPHEINNCSISELSFDCVIDPNNQFIHFGLLNVLMDNYVRHLGSLVHTHAHPIKPNGPYTTPVHPASNALSVPRGFTYYAPGAPPPSTAYPAYDFSPHSAWPPPQWPRGRSGF